MPIPCIGRTRPTRAPNEIMLVMDRSAWRWTASIVLVGAALYAIIDVSDPRSLDATDTFPLTGPGGAAVMSYLVAAVIVSRWWGRTRSDQAR